MFSLCFFFFQAEDGIRDVAVTGVQTCALPIYRANSGAVDARLVRDRADDVSRTHPAGAAEPDVEAGGVGVAATDPWGSGGRRVGKGGRSPRSPDQQKKKE